MLSSLVDEEYTRHPFYGSRRMVVFLVRLGHDIKSRGVQELMRAMGLVGMALGLNTSLAHTEYEVYPYLLRGVPVVRPNQVWGTDITYNRLAHGFAYLVAIIGWYSRQVLSWRASNSIEVAFCFDFLEEALHHHGTREIFNRDQGYPFTSLAFTDVLKCVDVVISIDDRGHAFDNIFVERPRRNVKYEDIYLKGYAKLGDLVSG
jgi:putative transposase